MKKFLRQFFSGEHGASPWIAVFAMTVLLGFTAMAVDLGAVYLQTSKLQAALDAGVLAGASHLPDTTAATAAAINCVQLNGYTASDVTVHFSDSNSKIKLSSAKEVDTMFLKALGINQWDINRSAAAAKTSSGSGGGVFDYRIFHGDTSALSMGGYYNINGDIHSNGSFESWPNDSSIITGTIEAVKNIQTGSFSIGGKLSPAQFIEMPDFSAVPAQIMPTSYDSYVNASDFNSIDSRQTWNGSKYITGNVTIKNGLDINGDVYINGNLTVNGGAPFLIKGNIYVTGKLTFTNTAHIYGSVIANKDILFQGGGFQVKTASPICIYSETGNIDLTAAGTTANGIVYAPKGKVNIAGSITIYGSIVAKTITGWPGSLIMGEPTMVFPFLPQGDGGVKLVE